MIQRLVKLNLQIRRSSKNVGDVVFCIIRISVKNVAFDRNVNRTKTPNYFGIHLIGPMQSTDLRLANRTRNTELSFMEFPSQKLSITKDESGKVGSKRTMEYEFKTVKHHRRNLEVMGRRFYVAN